MLICMYYTVFLLCLLLRYVNIHILYSVFLLSQVPILRYVNMHIFYSVFILSFIKPGTNIKVASTFLLIQVPIKVPGTLKGTFFIIPGTRFSIYAYNIY